MSTTTAVVAPQTAALAGTIVIVLLYVKSDDCLPDWTQMLVSVRFSMWL